MSRRRARGEGSISFHKGSGLYRGELVVGRKSNGRPDTRSVYGRTEEEVAAKLDNLRQQYKQGTLPVQNRKTVAEWADEWLRSASQLRGGRRREGLAENTIEVYSNGLRYLKEEYGTLLLKDLTGEHLETLYVKMREGGASVRQCEIVHKVTGQMLRAAVKRRLIPRDVTQDVANPPKAEYDDPRTLTPEEFNAILEEARKMRGTHGRWAVAFQLAIQAALARGELLGLQWRDVDFREGALHVERQVLRHNKKQKQQGDGKKSAIQISPLKARGRKRTVSLPEEVIAELREWHARLRKLTGIDILPRTAFVFPWHHRGKVQLDRPLSPEAVDIAFRKCCERAGVDDAVFHNLRATSATWMAEAGVPLKTAMAITGHRNPQTLLKHYTRVLDQSKREAANRIARMMKDTGTGVE